MSEPFWTTVNLDAKRARALHSRIVKPGRKCKWNPVGGGTMVASDNGSWDITKSEMDRLEIPEACECISVTAKMTCALGDLPADLIGSGPNWPYFPGSEASEGLTIYTKALSREKKIPIGLHVESIYGRQFFDILNGSGGKLSVLSGENSAHFYGEAFPDLVGDMSDGVDKGAIDGFRSWLNDAYSLDEDPLVIGKKAWDEETRYKYEYDFSMDTPRFVEREYMNLFKRFFAKEAHPEYPVFILCHVSFGGQNSLIGPIVNRHEQISKILNLFRENGHDGTYSVRWREIRSENWRERESRRKKLAKRKKEMEPEGTKMGILTLENGSEAEIVLSMDKAGYRFTAFFNRGEGLGEMFPETELFSKEEWELQN